MTAFPSTWKEEVDVVTEEDEAEKAVAKVDEDAGEETQGQSFVTNVTNGNSSLRCARTSQKQEKST